VNIRVDHNVGISYPTGPSFFKEFVLMTDATATEPCNQPTVERPKGSTAVLVLSDGTVFWGYGIGKEATVVGEICFNTSMTGYQEIITDPSYAGQIITFTFPHIGNVGTNTNDHECENSFARGIIIRADVTSPSNYRATKHFSEWLTAVNLTGISGIDTRSLTRRIRINGAINGAIAYSGNGDFNLRSLHRKANDCPSLAGMDLASKVSCDDTFIWSTGLWNFGNSASIDGFMPPPPSLHHIVAIDYGTKYNILRNLRNLGAEVTVVPAFTSAETILALNPDGIFLSNGPGDPAATGSFAVPIIKELLRSGKPIFGICLGHQMLALALGAKTEKMKNGHRGGNHPVKHVVSEKIEITSQNHGFVVSENTLPKSTKITHRSLFDGSIEGFEIEERGVFSVQYHPEASPGPTESDYLFRAFLELIQKMKKMDHA
tara:strand:+ start:1928 stop:3223 length:1296 start_codon:yes stop_codon:yes gene_type:complete